MENKIALNKNQCGFNVQICFAPPSIQTVFMFNVIVSDGSSIRDAVKQMLQEKESDQHLSKFELEKGVYGIFGRKMPLNTRLKKGDRVEIYHPLIANPMDARRLRVNKATKINVKN